LDEPLAEHVIEEFMQETKLCAREWVYVAMRRHLVIFKVIFMIKLTTRSMFLASSMRTHQKSPDMPQGRLW